MSKSTVTLGSIDAIPLGEGRAFVVDGESITVFRTRSGDLFATQAFCPHARGPLADGLIGKSTVLCPLHAFAFDLPSGRALSGSCDDLRTYAVSKGSAGEIVLEFPRRDGTEASPSLSSRGREQAACSSEGTAA